jgi:hypothetical protein|tara:strand:+ start:1050 stop:1664 length:615 start_codon:yes stop_codon:yes gene_type:complete
MWYYDSQIIKTPKAMVISGITHPKDIFKDSAMLTSLGIKPYKEVRPDNRYYWPGSYSVDTSGDEVVGTFAGTVRDLATLRTQMLERTNAHVAVLHAEIDWYWTRAAKGGTAVSSAMATYATALYSEHETKKTEIAALNTIAKIKEYEARAYTQVDKVKVYDGDGVFTGYHDSNTTSTAREIDMTVHFTVHPNKIDAGLVSLTAD